MKAMIRNRYNYLTTSVKTPKGKKDALKATAPQSKHYKQKAKKKGSFPKTGQMAIQIKNYQVIHAKTYNDRNSKPQQKYRLITLLKKAFAPLIIRSFDRAAATKNMSIRLNIEPNP